MEKIYLVTGACGHLGSTVLRVLLEEGYSAYGLYIPSEKHFIDGVEYIEGDVTDVDSLIPFFEKGKGKEAIVIHCAGIVSVKSGFDQMLYDVNVTGTKNIADLCYLYGVKKLVYVSTVHALPELKKGEVILEIKAFDPDKVKGAYAKTKATATKYVLDKVSEGLDATIVHPSGIIGPYDYGKGHLSALIIDYCNHKLMAAVKGGYDFVDVRDVAKGIISASKDGRKGECYILSNRYYEVKEIISLLAECYGKSYVKCYLPLKFVKCIAPLSEAYYKILKKPPLFTPYSIYTLGSNAIFSHEKADKELSYRVRDMRETLDDSIKWFKQIGRI